jgi:hypothetical protein
MKDAKSTFTKKKALRIVFIAAAILLLVILLRSCRSGSDVSTTEGRQTFLQDLGWEIDPSTEDLRTVQLPKALEGSFADYNQIQLDQGYDLSRHLGEQCHQVTYRITNYPDEGQTVLVTLYIQEKNVIAGDIHSTALNGFMQGLKKD